MANAFKLPDTGQTKCYRRSPPHDVISCAGDGQDGAYNFNPMSYTNNSNGTVTDNNTGLIWQKNDDDKAYNWFQASGTYDAIYNSNSTSVCGSLMLGGYADWRLPSKKELITIVDFSIPYPGPTINTSYFINKYGGPYWVSTPRASVPTYAWFIDFSSGYVDTHHKASGGSVKCVRGRESAHSFVDNKNGTVTDSRTKLMWQQGEFWFTDWNGALTNCQELMLGGFTDWRMPNIKELESLSNAAVYDPAIDSEHFPYTHAIGFWSSTTDASDTFYAWGVDFSEGRVDNGKKEFEDFVRCVRGGFNNEPTIEVLIPSTKISTVGVEQTFTASYGDVDGYSDLKTVDLLVSSDGTVTSSIWVRYNRVTNKLFLHDDSGTALLDSSCTPGDTSNIQNSQGRLNCRLTSVSVSGNTLTMKWRIFPKAAFASLGTKKLKMKAVDKENATSGWALKGNWTVKQRSSSE